MNGKQAKRLRRIALGLAATVEESGRKIVERGTTERNDQIINRDDSLRGIVRTLKRGISKRS